MSSTSYVQILSQQNQCMVVQLCTKRFALTFIMRVVSGNADTDSNYCIKAQRIVLDSQIIQSSSSYLIVKAWFYSLLNIHMK